MPRPERVLDPGAGPVESFAAELRELRRQAGNPGYRELGERAGYSVATLANAAGGQRLPSLEASLAFVRACGADPADWEQRWRRAAAEVAALRPNRAGTEDPPYRGLTGYGTTDGDRFFGRRRMVSQLVGMLARQRFVAVFGASGSGKSSLLRAGLIPALARSGQGGRPERVNGSVPAAVASHPLVLLTPGSRPLTTLTETVRADRDVLLVVDQFEELFTLCHDPAERTAFVARLAALVDDPATRSRVVIGVRADFFARCTELPGLAALLAGAAVPVGPLSEDELREVITGPANLAGLTVERALVTKILADVSGQPGALPLVSHALLETWRQRRADTLTVAGYEATGGVAGAIAQTADALYQRFDAGQRETARQVLLRMVTLGDGVEDTRRRVHQAELDLPGVDAVLDELAAARLVVLGEGTVEVAHEALIRAWPRLQGWLHADRETLRLHHQLTEACQIWQSLGREPGALFRGVRLAAWDDHPPDRLNEAERAFLVASREREAREQATRRRRGRVAVASLTAAIVVMSVLAGLAKVQANRAAAERDLALSRQLAAEARRQLQLDPEVALLLARRAFAVRPTAAADAVLRQAVEDHRARAVVPGHQGRALGVAFSADGQRLASTSVDGAVRLWTRPGDGTSWGPPAVLRGHRDESWSPVFSRDGRRLATAGVDRTVRVWDIGGTGKPTVLRGHQGRVWNVAFSPDGKRVASASEDGTVRVWDARGTGAPLVLRGHQGPAVGVAFSPDGRRVASSGHDRTVRIWDVGGRGAPVVLLGHDDATKSLAFSPDGRRLASASIDGTARVWPTSGRGSPVVLRGHEGTLEGLAFSRDGRWLATTSDDTTVRIWNPAGGGNPLVLRGHKGTVWAASFSPDGRLLASAGEDGTVRIWDPQGPGHPVIPGRHDGPAWAVAFNPDGSRLVSGGTDGTVRIWSATGRGDPRVLRGHRGGVVGVAASPDRRQVASAGEDGTLRVWDTVRATGPLVLRGHKGPVWTAAFSPDGRLLASAGRDGTLRIWDPSGHRAPLVRRADRDQIRYVAFSPDGKRVASAGWDGTVRVWDTTGAAGPLVLRGHDRLVFAVAFSPDGRRLASAGTDGTVRIWDTTGAADPLVLRGHQGMVWHLAFSPDGERVASTGKDGTLRLWRIEGAGEPVVYSGFGASVEMVAFRPDGQRLATAHGDGTVRVWRCDACRPIDQVREQADTRATRELTPQETRTILSHADS